MGEETANNAPEKAPTSEKEIERIGDIIKNARGTWFVLLGSLVFAAITLASVKDASFFITSEQTKLPLLGISVPVTSFFWAGALLIAALYTYLHLYLVQLWDALAEADARVGDKPLADVIHPWLVSDAALRVRDKRRGAKRKNPYSKKPGWKNRLRQFEWWLVSRTRKVWLGYKYRWRRGVRQFKYGKRASQQRGMSKIGNLVSVLLVWGFGLIIIGWFWWRSMPAHSLFSNDWPFLGLTGWLGILLVWSLYVFWRSGSYALARLGGREKRFPARVLFIVCVGIIAFFSFVRAHHDIWEGDPRINRSELADASKMTNELGLDGKWSRYALNFAQEFIRPARAEMAEVVFTRKPAGWKGFDLAKQEFRLRWCKQLGKGGCDINPLDESARFDEKEEKKIEIAWKKQQEATLATFNKPDLRGKRLEGADLRSAKLEGVGLAEARLQGADLSMAKLHGADFSAANLQGTNFAFSIMESTNFVNAELQNSNFDGARMYGSDLNGVSMQYSNLSGAQMVGIDMSFANLEGVDLSFSHIKSSDLEGANLQRADLSKAIIHGTKANPMRLNSIKLREANFFGVALRFVSFESIDYDWKVGPQIRNLNKGFGDGSVELPKGTKWPARWCKHTLSNAEYWGRYRGWLLAANLGNAYDDDIEKHPLIPFSEPCPK